MSPYGKTILLPWADPGITPAHLNYTTLSKDTFLFLLACPFFIAIALACISGAELLNKHHLEGYICLAVYFKYQQIFLRYHLVHL